MGDIARARELLDELAQRRDEGPSKLDEHVFLREELRKVQIDRDEAREDAREARDACARIVVELGQARQEQTRLQIECGRARDALGYLERQIAALRTERDLAYQGEYEAQAARDDTAAELDATRRERDLAREALLGAHEILSDYRAAAGCATPDVHDVGEGEA